MQNQEPAQRRSLCNVYVNSSSSQSRDSTSTSTSTNTSYYYLLLVLATTQLLGITYYYTLTQLEGQSAPQTPQPFFDADFEGLASNAELLYIFNQDDSQKQAWAYFGYVLIYAVYVV